MWHEGTHIECCDNTGHPNLVIGSHYYLARILKPRPPISWYLRLVYGKEKSEDVWGVLLFNDPTPYHHSHFRAPTRAVTTESFNLKQSPRRSTASRASAGS
jgi:hypothetical protein